jgi:ABC-type transport system involved in multi-copper enzyme maturation permease subunit
MNKLVRKELREQFKVAVIGAAILTSILIPAFRSCTAQIENMVLNSSSGQTDALQPLIAHSLLTTVAVFCALFGTILGWMQMRAEKHRDLWAFLIHRPCSRSSILWSKVISGLTLYSFASGLPLLGLIGVAATPGHVAAPFQWPMVLPITALFFAGMVFYLAGLLTGLRQARWYGSRGFGLGLAVASVLVCFVAKEFWQAWIVIVISAALLLTAVWGSFQTGGYYRDQSLPGRLSLIITSTLSGAVVLFAVLGVTVTLLSSRQNSVYSYYQVMRDGNICKITQRAFEDQEIVDLKGRPILDSKTGQMIKRNEFYKLLAPAWTAYFREYPRLDSERAGYSSSSRFFGAWRIFHRDLWYLTPSGRLIGYNGRSRQQIGTLEIPPSNVPGSSEADAVLLPENYYYNYFNDYDTRQILATTRTAYRVDLENRSLVPFFTAAKDDSIRGYSEREPFALIITRKAIRLMDKEGRSAMEQPYEPSPVTYPQVTVSLLEPTNRYAVRFDPDSLLNKKSGWKMPIKIRWVEKEGTEISKSMDLPTLSEPQYDTWVEEIASVLLPPPVRITVDNAQSRISKSLAFIPAAICALIGWWLGQRYNFSIKAKVGWGIFILLSGIPGLLAFLAVQEWPAREVCPGCKKFRVVDREKCEHCGADFAPPEPNGTEIFEPLTTDPVSR